MVTSFVPEDLPSMRAAPGVAMANPETNQSALLRFGDQDLTVTAFGTGESFPVVHDWSLQSGVFFSAARFPDAVQPFIQALPLTALNDGLRAIMNDGAGFEALGYPLLVLSIWGVGCYALAFKIFRWK
jgi:hypothetical protein